jgi:hypothetical protein
MSSANYIISNANAAVKVWNYKQRGGVQAINAEDINSVDEIIISTLSIIDIQVSKSKSNPQGSFQITLAPTRNWITALTAGSWCAILMAPRKLEREDLTLANSESFRMLGKIESVRLDTIQQIDGTRTTVYRVSGSDWGYLFNCLLYIDNFVDPRNSTLPQQVSIVLRDFLFSSSGSLPSFPPKDIQRAILNAFGRPIRAIQQTGEAINRLSTSYYDLLIPREVTAFLRCYDRAGNSITSTKLVDLLQIYSGRVISPSTYDDIDTCITFINSMSFQGSHSIWQLLQEYSNNILEELVTDFRWVKLPSNGSDPRSLKPQLALYNRVRPFSFRSAASLLPSSLNKKTSLDSYATYSAKVNADRASIQYADKLRSTFQFLDYVNIEDTKIISANVGTNWRDKYNFVEVKIIIPQIEQFGALVKPYTQIYDRSAFFSEGFRPLIVSTRHVPVVPQKKATQIPNIADSLPIVRAWSRLLAEWNFNTHRLLNGRITFLDNHEYIAVGSNIMFSARTLNPNPNFNAAQSQNLNDRTAVLAHVENVTHIFKVESDGTNSMVTIVDFVRGIFVDPKSLQPLGVGELDDAHYLTDEINYNEANVFDTQNHGQDLNNKSTR